MIGDNGGTGGGGGTGVGAGTGSGVGVGIGVGVGSGVDTGGGVSTGAGPTPGGASETPPEPVDRVPSVQPASTPTAKIAKHTEIRTVDALMEKLLGEKKQVQTSYT
ncbi:MAG: hypothetical protein ABI821_17580 [Pseudomonadota bacterium]